MASKPVLLLILTVIAVAPAGITTPSTVIDSVSTVVLVESTFSALSAADTHIAESEVAATAIADKVDISLFIFLKNLNS